ncbi:MAG: hypothetical protein U9O86_06460 [Campylobacterota bacterium]|nr:hypothetical protein [Campylobacterota bacterium]
MKHIFLVWLLCLSILHAKSVEEIAQEAHIASINTLLIFTSQEGLNSGLYHFSEVGADMEVYHLPFTYHFESDTNINYFIVGNVGYSRVFISDDVEIPPNSRLDYDNHLRTYTGGLGGGVRYKFSSGFSISGGLELIYSKSGASVKKPDDDTGEAIEDFFNQNYNDNLSYEAFANLEYRPTINEYKPYVVLTYKTYETKSTFNFDELNSFKSDSTIWTLSLGVESAKLMAFEKNYITLEGYYHANYLDGNVKEVVKFDTYNTLGGVAYFYTPGGPWWASRFFLELSTVQSSGLEGYNVGVGFSLDF